MLLAIREWCGRFEISLWGRGYGLESGHEGLWTYSLLFAYGRLPKFRQVSMFAPTASPKLTLDDDPENWMTLERARWDLRPAGKRCLGHRYGRI